MYVPVSYGQQVPHLGQALDHANAVIEKAHTSTMASSTATTRFAFTGKASLIIFLSSK